MTRPAPLRFISFGEADLLLRCGFTCVIRLVRRDPTTGICFSFEGPSSFRWNAHPGSVTVAPDFHPHTSCGQGLHAWHRHEDFNCLRGIRNKCRTTGNHLNANETARGERLLALQVPTSHLIEIEGEKVKFFAAITLGFVRPFVARSIIGLQKPI